MSWFKSLVETFTKPIEAVGYALTGNIEEAGNSLQETIEKGKEAFVDPIYNPDVQKAAIVVGTGGAAGVGAAAAMAGGVVISDIQTKEAQKMAEDQLAANVAAQEKLNTDLITGLKSLQGANTLSQTATPTENAQVVTTTVPTATPADNQVGVTTNKDKLSISEIPNYTGYYIVGIVLFLFLIFKRKV